MSDGDTAEFNGISWTMGFFGGSKGAAPAGRAAHVRRALVAITFIFAIAAMAGPTHAAGSSGWPHPEFQVENSNRASLDAPWKAERRSIRTWHRWHDR
jgi:hypothetical protein